MFNQKTNNMKTKSIVKTIFTTMFMIVACNLWSQTQGRPTVAVLNIDSKGVIQDAATLGYMVRLELEKTNAYNVMDKYDVTDVVKRTSIDVNNCYGKTCLVDAGRKLGVEKMLTGSVERFGEKIVITLKLIDVKSEVVEKSNTTEYLNLQPEMQKMTEISVKRLFGIDPDQNMVNLLVYYDTPIASPKTQLKLNGPRMGFSVTTGEAGKRLQDSKNIGGFDMYPATFQFGYQQEFQYLSAGNFQALVEFVPLIGGLESGQFIPSLTMLNGFRWSKSGWEFGFGPSFRLIKKADGFYDDQGYLGETGKWHLEEEYVSGNFLDTSNTPLNNPYPIVSRLDSRGTPQLSTGLLFAFGKTFKSGYLNMPFNAYVSPRKEGWIIGASFGFNIYKKPKVQ
jgi:hypothetical protein